MLTRTLGALVSLTRRQRAQDPAASGAQRARRPMVRRPAASGSGMVELLVVLPLLLFILMIAADFGRVFFTALTLANAARAGALYGVQNGVTSGDFDAIKAAAVQEGQNIGLPAEAVTPVRFCECPDGTTVDCTTSSCDAYGEPRVFVRVTATFTFRTLFAFPGMRHEIPLSQTATLRLQ